MGIGSIGGTYVNFILGTGSEEVGQRIKDTIKYRKAHNLSYPKALATGFSRGVKKSYQLSQRRGGYWKSVKNGFKAIPDGWKAGKGFGKLTGAFKGMGKAMPALMAFSTVLFELPNIYKATKEKGVGQGAKEVGKAAVRLTTGALCAALGTAILPIGGSIVGWMVGDWIGSKIVGKSYSEKTEGNEPKHTETPHTQNSTVIAETPGVVTGGVVPGGAGGTVVLPSVDINDFGPHRPYANIFFNNPMAYADMGARMPGQSGIAGYYGMGGMFPMMGFGVMGVPNNESSNLLQPARPGGNLLTPTGQQNAYNTKPTVEKGQNLNIEK